MAKLTYSLGGERKVVDVGDSCSIGRVAGNTIVLENETGASRRHCQITKLQNGFELADLGSTNGTKVNGKPVKRHKLQNGDRIGIGETDLVFDGAPVQAAAPAEEEEVSLEEPVAGASAGAPAASSASSEQCYLVFTGGDKDGQKIQLEKKRVTFGRNAKNTIQLTDTLISGYHAEISREGGAYVLRDLGSTNGTLLDGEPVSETALQHGARIRLGGVRLVFVDPTVSDFEKAMAAVDDIGSEWGLLRAEMDLTRVQRARRSQAIAIGAVLVVVLGLGFVVVKNPELISGAKPAAPENVKDNLAADFSFENDVGASWSARPGTPTKARIADSSDGNGRQGTAFYAVSRDGATGPAAAALDSHAFTIRPGQAYEFGAHVRTTGGARAGVRTAWLSAADGVEVGRSLTPLVTATDWQELRGTATPPDGARAARLELINAAGGTAFFDDVVFRPSPSPAGDVKSSSGGLTVAATADGQVTVSRGDATLLASATVVGGALRAEGLEAARRGERVGSTNVTSVKTIEGGVSVEGQAIDPSGGEPARFTLTVTVAENRYVDVKAELPEDVALVAGLAPEFVTEGMGVKTKDNYTRLSETRLVERVEYVSFGGRHRFRVAGESPFRLALYRYESGFEVGFGAAEKSVSLRLDTDSAKLEEEVTRLASAARDARASRRFGAAVTGFKQLATAFPGGSAEALQAEKDAVETEEEGRKRLAALEARAAGAVEFRDAEDLRAVERESRALATEFGGHDIGTKAVTVADGAAAAVETHRRTDAERDAQPLLRRANDFVREDMKTLGTALYYEIRKRFPGTKAAQEAAEKLAALGLPADRG